MTRGDERGDLRRALAHVLWIGGATDSGMTSVARSLEEVVALVEAHFAPLF